MVRRVLALSPVPDFLYLAAHARCLTQWDRLEVSGRKRIELVLQGWRNDSHIREAIVFAPYVSHPARVRASLKALAACGVRVQWFATRRNLNVEQAAGNLQKLGIELIQGDTMELAFGQRFPPASANLPPAEGELLEYLRYKIALCFMRSLDAAPLEDAVRRISTAGPQPFRLRKHVPREAASVEHFREADFPYLEGESEAVVALKQRIVRVASTDLRVLVTGERGTGKEAVALYLHELSPRRGKPFVAVNCAGLEEGFLRSELFGHVPGAFTSAREKRIGLVGSAEGGTLFLDELAEMPIAIQADLLRFLETRRYRRMGVDAESKADIRVIAATQPVLREKLACNTFRQDLYDRLAEVELTTPRLRDIPEDIQRIVRGLVYKYVDPNKNGAAQAIIDYFQRGHALLRGYPWPGNVRELAKFVKRRLLLNDDVLAEIAAKAGESGEAADPFLPVKELLRAHAKAAYLRRGDLTQKEVAARLGISINTFKGYLRA
jgi:DNA-binding NtrC family response regulator